AHKARDVPTRARQIRDYPLLHGIGDLHEYDWYGSGLALKRGNCRRPLRNENIWPKSEQFGRERWGTLIVAGYPSNIESQISTVAPTELPKATAQIRQVRLPLLIAFSKRHQQANSTDVRRLLRVHRERPCRRAADQ